MKLVTRDSDYAIRAVLYIASANKKIVSVREIETELKLPRPFLRKILQILQKGGILQSIKGKNGGFTLLKTPKKITLIDIIRTFQGEVTFTDCLLKKTVCPNIRRCQVRKKIKGIERMVVTELKGITIASLMDCL